MGLLPLRQPRDLFWEVKQLLQTRGGTYPVTGGETWSLAQGDAFPAQLGGMFTLTPTDSAGTLGKGEPEEEEGSRDERSTKRGWPVIPGFPHSLRVLWLLVKHSTGENTPSNGNCHHFLLPEKNISLDLCL